MNLAAFGIAVPLVFALALGFVQLTLRYVYSYTLTESRFEVRMFGRIPLYAIPWSELATASPFRPSLAAIARLWTTLSIGNRIFGRALVLERRGRFPRYVIVTPDDAERTLLEIRGRIANAPARR